MGLHGWKRRKRLPYTSEAETKRLIEQFDEDKVRHLPEATRPRTYFEAQEFYKSFEWQTCRIEFLRGKDRVCADCKVDMTYSPQLLNVDHKYPLRLFWNNRVDHNNLQILCCDCNEKKGNEVRSTYG